MRRTTPCASCCLHVGQGQFARLANTATSGPAFAAGAALMGALIDRADHPAMV